MQDFHSRVIRFLARHAGKTFKDTHDEVLAGTAPAVLDDGAGRPLLKAIKKFAQSSLYSSRTVRNRELTAQAVLRGSEIERDAIEQLLIVPDVRGAERLDTLARRDRAPRRRARWDRRVSLTGLYR